MNNIKLAKAPFGLKDIYVADCPFCGSEASLYGTDHDDRSLEATIMCTNCNANMDKYLAHGSKEAPSQDKLNELEREWNRRVTNG